VFERARTDLTRPVPAEAVEKYGRVAPSYDRRIQLAEPLRRRAVERLALRPGDTVVDVACGTGLTFELLEREVGPEGRVIGVDLSPDMLALARGRTESEGWDNVTLIEAPMEEAVIPARADAAVLVLTHDVMSSPQALANVVSWVDPGGTLVATGGKLGPRWALPLNAAARAIARRYVTTTEGYDRPWSHLADIVENLRVEPLLLGFAYVATGRVPS
jgi:ubiquinone/menaquinone biosynthesis C-methylase UbiE